MLSAEQNQRITRVGPGTPMGDLMRRYWQPALLSEEVPEPDAPPVRVQLLGEDLVAFRDSAGRVGLVDAFCPHRRAPLFFGRNEECGLRCVYHGWKFATDGSCMDVPSEPPTSVLRTRVSLLAYPTIERAGLIWAYLGPDAERPPEPDYEWLRAPSTHVRVSKVFEGCNWLQALEGGIDTAHSSFAHRNSMVNRDHLRAKDTHPSLEVTRTGAGFTYAGIRHISGDEDFVRVYQFILPNQQLRGRTLDMVGKPRAVPLINGHIWVPMTDDATAVYNFSYSVSDAVAISDEFWDHDEAVAGRGPEDFRPGTYWLSRNMTNDFLISREMQRTTNFTGIVGINTQDFALQEGMGPICDRSKEHLGTSDKAIISARRLLLGAIDDVEAGRRPPGVEPSDHRNLRAAEMIVANDRPWAEQMDKELTPWW